MDTKTPFRQREHLDYPRLTMFQLISRNARSYPEWTAYSFFRKKTTYRTFLKKIERCARALTACGVRPGDAVTICLPNIPQAIDCFYAINRIGAVANMVHPLSAENEITFYLDLAESRIILTANMFYEKVAAASDAADHPVRILVTRMQDELPPHLALGYSLTQGKDYLSLPGRGKRKKTGDGPDLTWNVFLRSGKEQIQLPRIDFDEKRTSVILYSGGTSGVPKGVCLTDLNMNGLALQAREAIGMEFKNGYTMLSCMPIFHGFGLGINIHTVLLHGAECILMPTFTIKTYADKLIKEKPNFIAGVPTIFEALLHMPQLDKEDLSFLKGMFCGGDSLTVELKHKIDTFLAEHGASIQVRQGYGLTECVTASCLTPRDESRDGSIGIPFPDTVYAIVSPGTEDVLPPGTEGEIILRSPTVMLGYLKNEEETAQALRRLPDGNIWLYTGDLGYMDEDGYVYFRQRIKRMIVTNGYNVYPGQVENIIDSCDEVSYSCVIGVPDRKRISRVRAYIVLRDNIKDDDECRDRIMEKLRKQIAGYALPREIIFRSKLPKTLVGKVAYRVLEQEALAELADSQTGETE